MLDGCIKIRRRRASACFDQPRAWHDSSAFLTKHKIQQNKAELTAARQDMGFKTPY